MKPSDSSSGPNSRSAAALAIGFALVVGVGALVAGAAAAPTRFELVFDGYHPATVHEGPFTASAPFCRAGYAADAESPGRVGPPVVVTRLHTCSDGSGTLTVRIDRPSNEHVAGGTGSWKILAGSGRYTRLRGFGTWVSSGGDPVFRSVMTGIVDFDDAAPAITIARVAARKLRRPRGAYRLRARLSARDDVEGNAVTYRVEISAQGFPLATRRGTTASAAVSLSLRIRPPKRSRSVKLEIAAHDPVGNERTVSRVVKLRP